MLCCIGHKIWIYIFILNDKENSTSKDTFKKANCAFNHHQENHIFQIILIQWKILQSVPVCQLSVKKRGLSYLISRRDPEKEEIFRVLKPPSNHKNFLLQGGDSEIKPIFPTPLLPWKGKISARNENFRRVCLLQYNNMPCCPLLSCVKSYNWRKKTSACQWSHH